LATIGDIVRARRVYERLKLDSPDPRLRAFVHNDLAALAAAGGNVAEALRGFQVALRLDPQCEPARINLAMLEVDRQIEGLADRTQESAGCTEESRITPQRQVDASAKDDRGSGQSAVAADAHLSSRICQRSLDLPKCLLLFITYNRIEYTRLAIDAVLGLDYPALEIVIWDNASTDGTPEYLKQRLRNVPNIRLELSPSNVGVVHPMNAAWFGRHDAELLAKVDNDTLVPPDLLRRLADCHVRSTHFGALSGFHFRKEGEAIAHEKNVVTVNGANVFRQRFVGGCAIMARRDVLERIGPIPSRRAEGGGPFMDGGWTCYQQRLDELGYINGYPWPFVRVDHMEDTRSPHCIRTEEHERYKRDLRGMSLDEFTQELCVWKPH
jgi:hypothetical protein